MIRPVMISSVLLIAAGLFSGYLRYVEQMPGQPPNFERIPLSVDGYIGENRRFSEQSYEVLQADTSLLRWYWAPTGESFWVFIAYFKSQKYGSQIHSPRHCLPGGGWKILELEPFALPVGDNHYKSVNRLIITEQSRRELMFYWYETRGGSVRSEFALKWDLMVNSLLLRPTDAAIIRLNMPMQPGESLAEATRRALIHIGQFYDDVESALPFAEQKT
jgi:EpsI family protein